MASDRAGVDKVSGTSAGLRCAGVFPVKAKPLARRARGLGTRHTQASTEHSAAGPPSHPAPFAPKTGGLGSGERAATDCAASPRARCTCAAPSRRGATSPRLAMLEGLCAGAPSAERGGWAGTGPVRCIAGGHPGACGAVSSSSPYPDQKCYPDQVPRPIPSAPTKKCYSHCPASVSV